MLCAQRMRKRSPKRGNGRSGQCKRPERRAHQLTKMGKLASWVLRTLFILAALWVQGRAQNPPAKQNQPVDVIRINTELIQTGVVVLDKHGHFVDGLQPEQFELKVEGKPQPISFFEQIKAGSTRERARLASLSDNSTAQPSDESRNDVHGRTIVFFIDDLHLALDSLGRTRKA